MYKSNESQDSYKLVRQSIRLSEHGFGSNGFLDAYDYKGILVLHCWHPGYLKRKRISKELLTEAVLEAINLDEKLSLMIKMLHSYSLYLPSDFIILKIF